MILQFSQFFDKEKQKPTYFAEKIWANKNLFEIDFCEYDNINYNIWDLSKFDNVLPKIHTIREDKTNRWKSNDKIQCYYFEGKSFRFSKKRWQFAPTFFCKGIQTIEIKYPSKNSLPLIWIDKIPMGSYKVQQLAINDGFENITDFFNWFNTDFTGKIIHFTNFRY